MTEEELLLEVRLFVTQMEFDHENNMESINSVLDIALEELAETVEETTIASITSETNQDDVDDWGWHWNSITLRWES